MGVQYCVGPPFAAITDLTLLGRLSTRFRSVSVGMFDHSSRSIFVRSGTDVNKKAWLAGSALIHKEEREAPRQSFKQLRNLFSI